jgi:alpha-galactosidase
VVDSAGDLHVAVRTPDDSVWWRLRDTSGSWSDWTSLGGTISGSPTLVAAGDTVHLYARAGDYTLWQRSFTAAGGWQGWTPHAGFASNAFTGTLGAVPGPGGSVLAAFRGVDGRVYQTAL